MTDEFFVTKSTGLKEPFSIQKLRDSLAKSKASPRQIDQIIHSLGPKLSDGITTKKIFREAYRLLHHQSKSGAARYHLKQGMLDLGPSGFPFEKYVGELFKHLGYNIQTNQILQGKCVTHEVDVIAENHEEIILMECKYRNQSGMSVDVKIPLYIQARFEDITAHGLGTEEMRKCTSWVSTNARFTGDAIRYAECKGMKMLSWDYPKGRALKDMIDQAALFPLTSLSSLTIREKQWLLAHNYVLVKDVYFDEKLLLKAGVKESRLKIILEEGTRLCR
jgi:hypothetical protein